MALSVVLAKSIMLQSIEGSKSVRPSDEISYGRKLFRFGGSWLPTAAVGGFRRRTPASEEAGARPEQGKDIVAAYGKVAGGSSARRQPTSGRIRKDLSQARFGFFVNGSSTRERTKRATDENVPSRRREQLQPRFHTFIRSISPSLVVG